LKLWLNLFADMETCEAFNMRYNLFTDLKVVDVILQNLRLGNYEAKH